MAPPPSDKRAGLTRRKSINPFSSLRSSTSSNVNTTPTTSGPRLLKKHSTSKRTSIFGLRRLSNTDLQEEINLQDALQDDKMFVAPPRGRGPKDKEKDEDERPSTGNSGQGNKRFSMFNSFSRNSKRSSSRPASVQEQEPPPGTVLFDGEVQTTSGTFFKKKEWMVLTDTYLYRFKNQAGK